MAVKLLRGPYTVEFLPKKASVAITANDLVAYTAAGYVARATATSVEVIGISLRTVASTDDDYASNTLIPVLIPQTTARFQVTTASAVQGDVGNAIDLSDHVTANRGASTLGVLMVRRLISATEIEVEISKKGGAAASAAAD